jgi:phosphatidylserine decarboxylase
LIAKGGRGFVGLGVLATIAALPFEKYAAIGFGAFTVFLAIMFRDPKRTIGKGIVAPADGTIREVDPSKGLVSTYLALRNVHVTRAPIPGVVEKAEIVKGRHAPAFAKTSTENQRFEILVRTNIGQVRAVEMVGALARRIVPYIKEGQSLAKGEKLSLIRFGSRVDLFLPVGSVRIIVKKGQKVRAGLTQIAEVPDGGLE